MKYKPNSPALFQPEGGANLYNAPATEVIHLKMESILCESKGSTQDYGVSSIFSAGTDNDD